MTTDRLAALLAEVTTRANAVVREQDAIDFIDWCRDDLPAAAGVIVAQPAEWPCVNCGASLVVCGEPRCCNDCDHPAAAQPATDALRAAAQAAVEWMQPDERQGGFSSPCQCCGDWEEEGHAMWCVLPALRAAIEEDPRG